MKRSLRTLICAALAAALLLPAVVYGAAASGSSTGEPAAAAEDSQAQDENEDKKDIMILYTSDIHCGIDEGFGYAGLEQILKYEQEKGYEVILVDDGDNIQGDPLGLLTKGDALIDLMNKMGYSVAIPGNHEFDYGVDNFLSLAEKAQFKYISCNFQYKGENVFDPYVIREIGGRKIGFVGVTTPTTITASKPTLFEDENGEFVYSFLQDETGEGVYNAVQSAVDNARTEGAEYVIVLGHLGNEEQCRPWTYADVISHTNGIDAFLDGHSHDTDQVIMKNKDGKEVPRSACGTKMQHIGWCRIPAEGEVTAGIYSWTLDDSAPEVLGIENEMSTAVKEARGSISKLLEGKIAVSEQEMTIYDPVAVDPEWGKVRMIRRAETNLGDLCTDAYRFVTGADIALLGGGGIRVSIPAGDVTMKNMYEVFPFGNEICVVQATGQQILDALEWGAAAVPGENGGFMQVSGLSYEIHTYIDSTCTKDVNGMFTGVAGERRVRNVKVNGTPIDPDALYNVAGNDYWFLNGGDGQTAFNGAERVDAGGLLDVQLLVDYLTGELGGVIGKEYSDPTGQGRIVIVEEKPAE
ncbi:2',3'-cyclic-nucleotide 2'-phosphodiesterase/5'-or 3'-nucleotidase, 5'-nucleotidase family [Sarcina sp. DSM 11001]|uniref:bifunctional metallophosphatase/5'-nucleotidase n=1 Tax=Sarcina sp. DSM 11001 TaxID=1798184 RepID=UPI0008898186|nr:bifunctional UDP-sugar hydrolase/5'-nucleotidase [Sarcina sp. DSM 11001]SDK79644.1 2',3'-cyclic-nucleotide 2'-phosphodiesterase/5'-or 3'-nucleotidase, 5'-nucleotidase family [Sarcina sp. DSM 11001]